MFPILNLSDFFYVWLKRTVGDAYPEFFSTPLTPKRNEIVAYSNREGGFEAGKRFFEEMLNQSFQEILPKTKSGGTPYKVMMAKTILFFKNLNIYRFKILLQSIHLHYPSLRTPR